MTDFSGWDMPLHYGSQLAEHEAVRHTAGAFDVSHMCPADLSGKESTLALQTLMANDVAKLAIGQAQYTTMLNEQGGVIDDLIIYRLVPNALGEHYRIVHNAGRADVDIAWIQQTILKKGWDVDYRVRRDLAMIAIQGPQAIRIASSLPYVASHQSSLQTLKNFYVLETDPQGDCLLARTGYTGEDGFEWMIPAADAEGVWQALMTAGIKPCGLGARDTLRLEAGMSLYGQDLDSEHTPLECGIGWSVALKDTRMFIGREALQKQPPRYHTLGLILMSGGVLRAHQQVRRVGYSSTTELGEITSGGFSPTLKHSIALARLPLNINIGDTVEVNIRQQWLPAQVVKASFVRHGKSVL